MSWYWVRCRRSKESSELAARTGGSIWLVVGSTVELGVNRSGSTTLNLPFRVFGSWILVVFKVELESRLVFSRLEFKVAGIKAGIKVGSQGWWFSRLEFKVSVGGRLQRSVFSATESCQRFHFTLVRFSTLS